jgi:hypothetical protein
MRTRARRFGLVLSALLLVAAIAPLAAVADVIPDPAQVPLPPTTQTAATTTGTGPDSAYWEARRNSSSNQGFVWYLLETMIFVGPLLLTILIEVPVVAISGGGSAASWKVGVLANTLTNPIAVVVVMLLAGPAVQTGSWIGPLLLIAGVEIAVAVVEWRVFRWALGWSNRRALVTSLIANALSFGVGFMILRAAWM